MTKKEHKYVRDDEDQETADNEQKRCEAWQRALTPQNHISADKRTLDSPKLFELWPFWVKLPEFEIVFLF